MVCTVCLYILMQKRLTLDFIIMLMLTFLAVYAKQRLYGIGGCHDSKFIDIPYHGDPCDPGFSVNCVDFRLVTRTQHPGTETKMAL